MNVSHVKFVKSPIGTICPRLVHHSIKYQPLTLLFSVPSNVRYNDLSSIIWWDFSPLFIQRLFSFCRLHLASSIYNIFFHSFEVLTSLVYVINRWTNRNDCIKWSIFHNPSNKSGVESSMKKKTLWSILNPSLGNNSIWFLFSAKVALKNITYSQIDDDEKFRVPTNYLNDSESYRLCSMTFCPREMPLFSRSLTKIRCEKYSFRNVSSLGTFTACGKKTHWVTIDFDMVNRLVQCAQHRNYLERLVSPRSY